MRILIFGDSVAQGYYDLEMGGWVNLLFIKNIRRKVRRVDNPLEIFNLAVSGDTTRRVIDRLKVEVDARKWENEPIVLIFAVGINDAVSVDKEPLSSPGQYRADLEALYATAQPLTQHVVFVGLTAVNEPESNPWIFNSGTSKLYWTNKRIQQFDKVLRDFAEEKNAYFVSIFDTFKNGQTQEMSLLEDGLHPNSLGHQLIFKQVQPIIDDICS